MEFKELIETGKNIRKDIIDMLYKAGSGHPGGSLSCVELMAALSPNFLLMSFNNSL